MKRQVVQNNELTTDLAARLAAPLVEFIHHAPDDTPAKAVIIMLRAVAREENPEVRRLFANDIAEKIFAATFACRDAALSFGEFSAGGTPKTFAL